MVDILATRLIPSGANLWLVYISAKVFEQLNQSPRGFVVRPFVYWINRFEQQITNTLDPNCSVEELGNRLLGLTEVSNSCHSHFRNNVANIGPMTNSSP